MQRWGVLVGEDGKANNLSVIKVQNNQALGKGT